MCPTLLREVSKDLRRVFNPSSVAIAPTFSVALTSMVSETDTMPDGTVRKRHSKNYCMVGLLGQWLCLSMKLTYVGKVQRWKQG